MRAKAIRPIRFLVVVHNPAKNAETFITMSRAEVRTLLDALDVLDTPPAPQEPPQPVAPPASASEAPGKRKPKPTAAEAWRARRKDANAGPRRLAFIGGRRHG